MDKLLLTIEDVCEILSIKRSKVYALIKDDGLPTVKIGKKTMRVPTAQFREWIEARLGDGSLS